MIQQWHLGLSFLLSLLTNGLGECLMSTTCSCSQVSDKEYEIIDSDDKIVVVLYKSEDKPKVAIETGEASDPNKPIEATVVVEKDF